MADQTVRSPYDGKTTDQWAAWSNQQLRDYESSLYDREVDGEDTWFERDEVLWEMNQRGLCK